MTSVVIDANIAIYAVLPVPQHQAAYHLIASLIENQADIVVPHLWLAEVATGIRKTAAHTHIPDETDVLEAALALPIKLYTENISICRNAYQIAVQLGQRAVYDSVYLALARELRAEFWTADRRLYNRCQDIAFEFVHLLESIST